MSLHVIPVRRGPAALDRSKAASSLTAACLFLALLAPHSAADSKSAINFCNVGNTALFVVVIGQTPGGGISMDGWQEVQIGDCHSVAALFRSTVGFAIAQANGRKAMQVYDRALFPDPAVTPTESRYCVDPAKDFHREHVVESEFTICRPSEVLARFAFFLKLKAGATLTLRVPADKDGETTPFETQPPFELNAWISAPRETFMIAMSGLAEQQERLGFRIARREISPTASWSARYISELGVVARPETHAVSVIRGSPAFNAGIRQSDEIAEIDGIEIKSAWHARSLMMRTRPGETHMFAFLHDGQLHTMGIRLDALPADLASTDLHPKRGWLGIEFESSARVVGVIYRDGTPHLELDDDIQRIGRVDFDGVDGLAEWLTRDRGTAKVELQVWRPSARQIMVMTLDKLM